MFSILLYSHGDAKEKEGCGRGRESERERERNLEHRDLRLSLFSNSFLDNN